MNNELYKSEEDIIDAVIRREITFPKEDTENLGEALGFCYETIQKEMEFYMDVSEEVKKVVPLWIIGTYFMPIFDTYPYLYFNAMRGSGKTRMEKFIASLAFGANNQVQTGITESVLFRSKKYSTLILDECEDVASKDKAILRQYLNASYKRGSTVKRSRKVKQKDGEGYVIEEFEPYRPIVMANINGMDSVTQDRCLTFILNKSNNPAYTKIIEDFEKNITLSDIKRTLSSKRVKGCSDGLSREYTLSWNGYIKAKYTEGIYIHTSYQPYIQSSHNLSVTSKIIEDGLFNKIEKLDINGRNLELIFPLINVARMISDEFLNEILPTLASVVKNKMLNEFEDDKDVSLIEYIASYKANMLEPVRLTLLKQGFREFMSSFEETDRWLNETWLGVALKRLSLITYKKRTKEGVIVLLNVPLAQEKLKMFKGDDK
jgi:hypothetical protein